MDRIRKLKNKTTGKRGKLGKPKTKTKLTHHSNEHDTDLHASLSDSIFKDSFDKFLGDRGDRRKQLNLKANVRASFNRDSSFELSTTELDETANPLPITSANTICSTPNFKFGRFLGTLANNEPRNESSDLFASYLSEENFLKSQSNRQRDSEWQLNRSVVEHGRKTQPISTARNELDGSACDVESIDNEKRCRGYNLATTADSESFARSKSSLLEPDLTQRADGTAAYDGSMSNIQFCSVNGSDQDESKFFKCLRKKTSDRFDQMSSSDSGDSNNEISQRNTGSSIDNLHETRNVSDSNHSSIDPSNAENDRLESCLEISSEASSSHANATDFESSKLNSINGSSAIKLERDSSISSHGSSDKSNSRENVSIDSRTMSNSETCQPTKHLRRLRRTIIGALMDRIKGSNRVKSSKNFASTSPEAVDSSTSSEAIDSSTSPKAVDLCGNSDSINVKSSDDSKMTDESNVSNHTEFDELIGQQENEISRVNSGSTENGNESCDLQDLHSNSAATSHPIETTVSDDNCKPKRSTNEVTSPNTVFNSQFVATRKKPKLLIVSNDASELNEVEIVTNNSSLNSTVPSYRDSNRLDGDAPSSCQITNGIPNENLPEAAEVHEEFTASKTDHPSSLVNSELSTRPNEIETSKQETELNARGHLSDISNKLNFANVTKRKHHQKVKVPYLPSITESSEYQAPGDRTSVAKQMDQTELHSVTLPTGKWRRSLSLHRKRSVRSAYLLEQATDVVESIDGFKIPLPIESNHQKLHRSVSVSLSRDNCDELNKTSDRIGAARRRRTSVINPTDVGRLTEFNFRSTHAARDTILRKCGQSEPLPFEDIYSQSALRHCRKIGEGVYGEVFMNKTDAGRAVVLKIIPIEGTLEVNGEPQKKFDEVLSEIVIALELSSLRNDKECMTSSFAEVIRIRCVQGRYPSHLIDLWELYRDNRQTENDHPEIFDEDQLYIVFELANGGQDLEAFQFTNASQAKSTFQQAALALAIAETKLQFEHRDLHWGNILLSATDEKFIDFKFNGNTFRIPSDGIRVTIIDYTLSRMIYDGIVLYNDLSNDQELFTAHGDYQFDIYRLMKSNLDNDWQRFEPFNNILWLHYIVDKLINGARYKNTKSRKHRSAIEDLMVIRDEITNSKSAVDRILLMEEGIT